MKILHLVTAAAVALSAPAFVGGSGIPTLDEYGAAHAGKGNGQSNGKGGGSSSEKANNSGGKSDKASGRPTGKKSKTVSRGRDKQSSSVGGKLKTKFNSTLTKLGLKKKTRTKTTVRKASKNAVKSTRYVRTTSTRRVARPTAAPREKNLNAQLKGLNSLNRNANGFFNGKDSKLDPLRDFVASSAAYTGLEDALSEAQSDLTESQGLLDGVAANLGLTSNDLAEQRAELENLQEDLLADEPALDDPARSEWEAELAAVEGGLDAVDAVDADTDAVASAEGALEEAEDDVSEDALRQAIADSMNSTGNDTVVAEDVSDGVVGFVSDRLGVGDAVGFIDVAVEDAESEDELSEDVEGSEESEPVEDNDEETETL